MAYQPLYAFSHVARRDDWMIQNDHGPAMMNLKQETLTEDVQNANVWMCLRGDSLQFKTWNHASTNRASLTCLMCAKTSTD